MKNKRYIITMLCNVLFVFGVCSCSKDTASSTFFGNDDNVTLLLSGNIKIKIDNQTSYKSIMMSVWNDSILTYENRQKNCIQFYHINKQSYISKLCFDVKGPDGTGNIVGHYIQNMDSIYINGDHTREIVLVNQDKKVLQGFRLSSDFGTPAGVTFFPMEKINNKLYFPSLPDYNLYSEMTVGQEMEIAYDLNTKSHSEHFHFPEEYEGFHNTYYITYSRTINDAGDFVYSFPMCHHLYVKDKNGRISKMLAESKYALGVTIRKNTAFADNIDETKAYIEGYAYRFIIFDKYRKVYYRFVHHPMEYIDPSNGLARRLEDKPESIIILDENFNKIGEYELPVGKYLTENYFVNSEGLWISNNHPDNPDLDENFLSFTLFKLSSNKD